MTANTTPNSAAAAPLKQRLSLLAMLITIGIVYGDIGTSPLYVMRTILSVEGATVDADYIYGALSCIIWTLTLQTSIKYVGIALRADNKGEGGTLSLYALIRKQGGRWLYIVAALGAAMLIADGVITPAITVMSAVEGLDAVAPSTPVLPIVIVIISAVFAVQRYGTAAIGKAFGPFMLVWFLMLGALGIAAMSAHWEVLKAFNPYYAMRLLARCPEWMYILGAVFLCTTGAEALYSDLGHCGRRNITATWVFVKAMLILNYLGQGAWILDHLGRIPATQNPFYAIMPQWMLLIGIVIATGAAIIASQALISGSFSIFSEAVHLNLWPNIQIKYPTLNKGQLYIPSVNAVLYIGCILTVVIFQTSSHMEAAYGLAITFSMLTTTLLLTVWMHQRGVSRWLVGCFATVYVIIEGLFLTANMFKFAHGGWYTCLIAAALWAVMDIWYRGNRIRTKYIDIEPIAPQLPVIADMRADTSIPQTAANLVFITRVTEWGQVEKKLLQSLIDGAKRADHYFLLRVEFTEEPDTLCYEVRELSPGSFFDVKVSIGYHVSCRLSAYMREIFDDLVAARRIDPLSNHPSLHAHGIEGDFKFFVIRRVFSPSSVCPQNVRFVMSRYEVLRHLSASYEDVYGLDTSNYTLERVPLILKTAPEKRIVGVE
jgi:KUP system potassium uptake protein